MFAANGIKNLDPKVPITMEELLDIARKLTTDQAGKHPGESGFDAKRIKTYGYDGRTQWSYVFAFGGEYFSEDGKKTRLNDPAAAEGLQFLADFGAKHYVMPSPEYAQASPVTFPTGAVGILYDGVWGSVRHRQNKFDWDIAPFPQAKNTNSTGWYSGLSVTAGSKLKEAAWEWIYFCCSEPGQQIVSGLGQAVPVIKALANTKAFLDPATKPASKQTFLDLMDGKLLRLPGDKQGSPFMGYWREHGQVLDPMLDAVWRGKKTAADALKEAEPKLNLLLAEGKVT
jgi:multiple sugar transport system substrate-binding protein